MKRAGLAAGETQRLCPPIPAPLQFPHQGYRSHKACHWEGTVPLRGQAPLAHLGLVVSKASFLGPRRGKEGLWLGTGSCRQSRHSGMTHKPGTHRRSRQCGPVGTAFWPVRGNWRPTLGRKLCPETQEKASEVLREKTRQA